MKYSPVRTIIKNLTANRRQFYIDREFSVTLTPAGTKGDTITLIGDAFSRDPNGAADYPLLLALKNGDIELSYKVDHVFAVHTESENPNMSCDVQAIREWYISRFGKKANTPITDKPEVTPSKPTKASEVATPVKPVTATQTTDNATTPAKPAEAKETAPASTQKPVEPVKTPEKAPEKAPEDTKAATSSADATDSATAKKAGRRIKVS